MRESNEVSRNESGRQMIPVSNEQISSISFPSTSNINTVVLTHFIESDEVPRNPHKQVTQNYKTIFPNNPIPHTSSIINVAPISVIESDEKSRKESRKQAIEILKDQKDFCSNPIPSTLKNMNNTSTHLVESNEESRYESDLLYMILKGSFYIL